MLYFILGTIRKYFRKIISLKYKVLLGHFGTNSIMLKPMSIDNPKNIFIGNNVLIQQFVWLAANSTEKGRDVSLNIQDNVTIGHFNHIYSTGNITIEKDVLTADKVYIGDVLHSYSDINIPIKNQDIKNLGNIIIGEGSWLGEGVCVIGANIGKHCIVGANSVVLSDIPDYSVAVGSPARVVKRFNFDSGFWEKII